MPQLSEDVLRKLISPKAKALSSPTGDKIIESRGSGRPYGADPDPNSFDDFSDDMYLSESYDEGAGSSQVSSAYKYDPQAAEILESRRTTDYSSNNFNPERVKSSKMLSAIKEELVRNPIDTTALNPMTLESANGGNVNLGRLGKVLAAAKQIDERAEQYSSRKNNGLVTETTSRNSSNTGGASVDYALIKSIIKECLDEKLEEMGTLKGIGLSAGKIKLVDNKGNVYLAKLEYKGNTKDNK